MKLRVLYVINGLGTGGSERSLAEMLPGLVAEGVSPTLAHFYLREEGVETGLRERGFELRHVESSSLPGRVRALRRLIRTERLDLVHTTHFEADLAGRLAAVGTGVPVVSSLVSTPYDEARFRDPRVRGWKLRAVQWIDGWTARHLTCHFHAVSAAVERASIATLGVAAEDITVIRRGRDPERMGESSPERRRRTRESLGLDPETPVLITVGRHDYAKGQRYLLEAMSALGPEHSDVILLIAGRRGTLSSELERMVSEGGLESRVRFLGHRDDVPDLLAASDLFVFPSLYEGMPGAVIEALALGRPVVASRLDSVLEIVEESGNATLVAPGSSAELAEAIGGLLDDLDRTRAYGTRSREIFEERFTLDRSVQAMADLYRRVTGSDQGPPLVEAR